MNVKRVQRVYICSVCWFEKLTPDKRSNLFNNNQYSIDKVRSFAICFKLNRVSDINIVHSRF